LLKVKHIIIIFLHCGIFNRILKIEFLRNKCPTLLLYYPFSIRTLTTVAHLYCVRSVHSAFCFHPLCCRIVYCVCIPTVTRIVSNRIRAAPSHSPSALQQEPEVEVKGQSSIALCEHAAVCGVHVTPRTNGNELVLQCTVSHPANPIWLLALLLVWCGLWFSHCRTARFICVPLISGFDSLSMSIQHSCPNLKSLKQLSISMLAFLQRTGLEKNQYLHAAVACS